MYRQCNEKAKDFIKELIALCEKYNLALESEDPYCGLELVDYDKQYLIEMYNNFLLDEEEYELKRYGKLKK